MTESKEIQLLDSNILIYAYDSSEKEKHITAKNLLADCWKRKKIYALSVQNLSELFVVTTKKITIPVKTDEMKQNIQDIIYFSNFNILSINKNNILRAIDISAEYGISYWDALIASVMKENNISCIITENDKDFKKISWLKVINPFVDES
ncbi:MAG: PIN domain-containing protein [Nanoarchaeota archaeon]